MKQFFSNPLNWLLLVIVTVLIFFLALVIRVDYSNDIKVERPITTNKSFSLYPALQGVDLANFKESFPYQRYLDSADFMNINSICADLDAMDSIHPDDEMGNQEVLSIALTEKLEEQLKPSFINYNPDSLLMIIQWAEKFNAYSQLDEKRATLFQVIYNHWFNFVSNTLGTYYEKSYTIKYNYKFKYINDRVREKQFITPIKGTYLEKVVNQLIQKNWSYLFNKFWHATTIAYKGVVLLFVFIIIFPYIYIFKRGFKNK